MEELVGIGNNFRKENKTLWTEKIFYIAMAPPPPRIAFSPDAFKFDLQRFQTHTVNSASELSTTISSATAGDTIKLDDSFTGTLDTTLTIDKNLTLDLNGKTLTTSANKGFTVSADKTFIVDDTGAKDTEGNFQGTIKHTAYDSDKKAKKNRADGDGSVGNNAIKLADGASFVLNGGNITSESIGIYANHRNNVTINGGTILSNKSTAVFFDESDKNTTDGKNTLTMNAGTLKSTGFLPTIQVSGSFVKAETLNTITLNGGTVEYDKSAEVVASDDKNTEGDLGEGAIFASGQTALTIKNGVTVTSSHVGIEFRGGTLNVEGGTIKSTNNSKQISFHETARGTSFDDGVAIAISKSSSGYEKNITVNISGGEISGYTALAVANPCGITAETTVNITGGTLESTSEADKDEAEYKDAETSGVTDKNSKKVALYTLKGKNAIVNFDEQVTVALSGTKVIGSVAAKMTGRDSGTGYNLGEGNTFSNFTYPKTDGELVSYYNVADTTNPNSFTVVMLGSNQSWNTKTGDAANTWEYLVKGATETEAIIATLAPKEGAANTLAITSEVTSNSYDVPLDLTDTNVFKDIDNYTVLDASGITQNINFNITGNDKITSIVGGSGADSLKAGVNGATLDGGAGDDSLVAVTGTKANTFLYQSGKDTIDGYTYGTDVVSLAGTGLTAPTDFTNATFDGSNFKITVGSSNVLTFKGTSTVAIANNDATYTYKASAADKVDYIAFDSSTKHGISLGAGHTSTQYNGTSTDYATINASNVTQAIRIRGNDSANYIVGSALGGTLEGNDGEDTLTAAANTTESLTLNGGAGDDLLIGGNVYNNFVYSEGSDSIQNYGTGNVINVTGRAVSFADVSVDTSSNDLLIKFDDDNQLSIAGGASGADGTVPVISITSGRNNYEFTKNYFALNGKSITLTSSYDDGESAGYQTYNGASTTYQTINAGLVTGDISIVGNTLDNYIVGGLSGNSLAGGDGDDTLVGGSLTNLFYYTAGKDVIENFGASDKLDISAEQVGNISSGKLTNSRLTFFTIDKKNDLTFKFGDNDPFEMVSLNSGAGYLTKDGVVSVTSDGAANSLKLFGNAKGRIDLNDELYSIAGASAIATVDASTVKSQSVTLVGGTQAGTFVYMENNKQRDGFEYGGGSATITGYEGGRDRIDLNGITSLSSFTVDKTGDKKGVNLILGNGSNISIIGAAGEEVLLRDAGSRGYKKMVFAEPGIVQNKKSNPTTATVSSGAMEYSFTEKPTVKKIFVTDVDAGASIQAGNRSNTIIDASKAAAAVSLSGGNKNDKLIGNTANADMFVYGAGKDVVQGFHSGDSISLSSEQSAKLESAKITASKKSIKFKFGNKDVLTIKSNDTMSGALNINGEDKIYFKNAIGSGENVSLTSGFSGTFRTQDTKRTLSAVTYVNGSNVEKNLTFVGSSANETLIGGNKKKTMFKGGGGADSLVGGSGKDTFFYAKGNEGDAAIANFDFDNDKLKVASGILGNVKQSGNTITFGMTKGKSTDAVVGSFNITSDKDGKDITPSKVAIKANNTLYWFATTEDANDYVSVDDGSAITAGTLITTENRISNVSAIPISAGEVSSVIDLNYSTNLAKSGVAIKVKSKTTT